MIDSVTRNKSFKRMRNILYSNNVNNSDFMLELKDSSLVDLPENPNVWSSDIRKKVIDECRNNFWFFVREIVRIPSKSNILYKDAYEYCPKFTLRLDTLRLFYAYTHNLNVVYNINDESSINEAIAILMIYEYIVKEPKFYSNYDNDIPTEILNIISNILTLNERTLFLDNIGNHSIVRNDDNTKGLNKFIFNISNISYVNDHNVLESSSKLICLDKLFDENVGLGFNNIIRDKLISFMMSTIKPCDNMYEIFDSKFNDYTNYIHIEPIYN